MRPAPMDSFKRTGPKQPLAREVHVHSLLRFFRRTSPGYPDPRFLFSIPGHQRTLGCLNQGIEEKNGWVLLAGEPGSGKTILIHPLLKGKEGEITPRKIATGETWHRFSAGMFANREEALRMVRAPKEKGLRPSFGGSPQKSAKNDWGPPPSSPFAFSST